MIISRRGVLEGLKHVLIVMHPNSLEEFKSRSGIIVFLRRSEAKKVRGYRRVYVRRLEDKVFQLSEKGKKLKLEATTSGLKVWKPRLKGYLAAAYRTLQVAITEYGPLSFSDSTTVIAGSLKIRREDARRIIRELVKLKMIEVEGGKVLIA